MAERIKIALMYYYDENWIGGTYYIQNLVSACNHIAENDKPEFIVIADSKKTFDSLCKTTTYPFLTNPDSSIRNVSLRIINKFWRRLFKKTFTINRHSGADIVFPAGYQKELNGQQSLYWIPDFQEHYLPEFFTSAETEKRKDFQQKAVQKAKYIVFSSESAKLNFNEIYPGNKVKQFVMPFAVTHHPLSENFETVKAKFNINTEYFICSNQFWAHKNHIVVLKAIKTLKDRDENIVVAFTGKQHDFRNPDFFNSLQMYVTKNGLIDNVRFLGFISRDEQLILMKNAKAVIQPSLFEGWSTVIEDCKSLNNQLVASNIDVHQEQLKSYSSKAFFDPLDEFDLANVLSVLTQEKKGERITDFYDYNKDIVKFADSFKDIVKEIELENQR